MGWTWACCEQIRGWKYTVIVPGLSPALFAVAPWPWSNGEAMRRWLWKIFISFLNHRFVSTSTNSRKSLRLLWVHKPGTNPARFSPLTWAHRPTTLQPHDLQYFFLCSSRGWSRGRGGCMKLREADLARSGGLRFTLLTANKGVKGIVTCYNNDCSNSASMSCKSYPEAPLVIILTFHKKKISSCRQHVGFIARKSLFMLPWKSNHVCFSRRKQMKVGSLDGKKRTCNIMVSDLRKNGWKVNDGNAGNRSPSMNCAYSWKFAPYLLLCWHICDQSLQIGNVFLVLCDTFVKIVVYVWQVNVNHYILGASHGVPLDMGS